MKIKGKLKPVPKVIKSVSATDNKTWFNVNCKKFEMVREVAAGDVNIVSMNVIKPTFMLHKWFATLIYTEPSTKDKTHIYSSNTDSDCFIL